LNKETTNGATEQISLSPLEQARLAQRHAKLAVARRRGELMIEIAPLENIQIPAGDIPKTQADIDRVNKQTKKSWWKSLLNFLGR